LFNYYLSKSKKFVFVTILKNKKINLIFYENFIIFNPIYSDIIKYQFQIIIIFIKKNFISLLYKPKLKYNILAQIIIIPFININNNDL